MAEPSDLQKVFTAPTGVADPEGTGLRGVAPGYDFTLAAFGHPELILVSKDGREVTFNADVFDDHVHLHCGFCRLTGEEHGLMVRKGVRDWLYEPLEQAKTFPGWSDARMMAFYPKGTGGRFQLAPITCPWCKTKFAIENNVVRIER